RPAALEDDVPIFEEIDAAVRVVVRLLLRLHHQRMLHVHFQSARRRRRCRYRYVAWITHWIACGPLPALTFPASMDRWEANETAYRTGQILDERAAAGPVDHDDVVAVDERIFHLAVIDAFDVEDRRHFLAVDHAEDHDARRIGELVETLGHRDRLQ